MTIYIASDIHGATYGERLDDPALADLTKDDFLIVCGDLVMIDADPEARAANIAQLEAKPYTTLFVDGNHEEFDVLDAYPVERWHGGTVHRISPSVAHLMRGQVFDLDGKSFFTMGGAPTFHKARLLGLIEGPDPGIPSPEELAEAERNLAARDWQVDYVLTHSAPTNLVGRIPDRNKVFATDISTWLEGIAEGLDFKLWLFGHYHCDCQVDGKYRCLFNNLYEVETGNVLREPQHDTSTKSRYDAIPLPEKRA